MLHNLLIAAILVFLSFALISQVWAQADVIEKRQQAMKDLSAANKAIKGAVESKDFATIEAKAKDINGTADKIVTLFPKGSTKGKTKATAAIWEKSDDFAKNAKNLSKASSELAAAAKSQEDAAVGAKFKALGETCASCHKTFRAEKYSE
jgi:cytochrome c556